MRSRVVALHEALAVRVGQAAAFAAHRFGDQRAGRLLRADHPGGVELDQLHVRQPAARPAAPGTCRRRSSRPGARSCAARCACARRPPGPLRRPERQCARPVWISKPSAPKQARRTASRRETYRSSITRMPSSATLSVQGAQDLAAGVVAGVAGAPVACGRRSSAGRACRPRCGRSGSPSRPAPIRPRGAPWAMISTMPRVGQAVALLEGVGEVLLPASPPGRHVPSAALIPPAASTVWASRRSALADHDHFAPGQVGGDGGPQPGRAGADDQYIGDVAAKR